MTPPVHGLGTIAKTLTRRHLHDGRRIHRSSLPRQTPSLLLSGMPTASTAVHPTDGQLQPRLSQFQDSVAVTVLSS
jgi:hypothetical protein